MAAVSSAGARNYYHCLRSLFFELYPDVEQERRRPDSRSALPQWPRAMFIGQFGILSPLSFDTTPIALAAGGGHKSQIGWQLWYFQPPLVIKHSLILLLRYSISRRYVFSYLAHFCRIGCLQSLLPEQVVVSHGLSSCQGGGAGCQKRTGELFHRLFISRPPFKSQHTPSKHSA